MKKYITPVVVLLITIISLATADWVASQYIRTRLVLQSGANMQALGSNTVYVWGTSSFDLGDSVTIKAGSSIAKIDSFTTTDALDTTVMRGLRTGDVLSVTQYAPSYSATPDTNVTYSATVLNNDSALIRRTINAAGSDLKSGGQYMITAFSKQ